MGNHDPYRSTCIAKVRVAAGQHRRRRPSMAARCLPETRVGNDTRETAGTNEGSQMPRHQTNKRVTVAPKGVASLRDKQARPSNCRDLLKHRLPSTDGNMPCGQGNDLGYGKNVDDVTMDNLQPSPKLSLKHGCGSQTKCWSGRCNIVLKI